MSIREKVEDKIYETTRKRYQKLKRWQKTTVEWLIGLAVVGYLLIRYVAPANTELVGKSCHALP